MARRNLLVAFLFGFAFYMTLEAMSFIGFLAPATAFENLVRHISDVAAYVVIIAGVAFVLICNWSLKWAENRTAGRISLLNRVTSFLIGIGFCLALVAMGMTGGYFGSATTWQHLVRRIAEVVVLIVAYGGAAFGCFDIVMFWHTERKTSRRVVLRIGARVVLVAVLLLFGMGSFLGDLASGAAFTLSLFLVLCLSIALELSSS